MQSPRAQLRIPALGGPLSLLPPYRRRPWTRAGSGILAPPRGRQAAFSQSPFPEESYLATAHPCVRYRLPTNMYHRTLAIWRLQPIERVRVCLCSSRQHQPSLSRLSLISPSRSRPGCRCSRSSSLHFQPAAMEFSDALMPPVLRFHCPINASTNDLWNLLGATLKTSET